jgi:hypothetical protein
MASFPKTPDMRSYLSILLLMMTNCDSRFLYDEPKGTEVIDNCTVVYIPVSNSLCDLYRKWTLTGIINRVGVLESPPCFRKAGAITQNFITIQFESTPHNLPNDIYEFAFAFTGEKLSPYGYHGSYQFGDQDGQIVLQIGASPLAGVDEKIADFESKFFLVLSEATTFKIRGNELFLSAGESSLAFFTTECQ